MAAIPLGSPLPLSSTDEEVTLFRPQVLAGRSAQRFGSVLILLLFCLGEMAVARAAGTALVVEREGIAEYRLDNGLRVLLAPNPDSTAIAFEMVYLTGSLADPVGKGGTAHLLEHLQFKGTERLPGKQLVESLSQRGIQFQATTSYERTRYSAQLGAEQDKLEHLIALEADRMRNSRFAQADLDAEREVVLREMAQYQDTPLYALTQGMFAAATPGRGMGRPVLGEREEVQRIDLDDLRAFYARHYQPGNALIVVTGRFDARQTLRAVEAHFGPLPGSPVTEPAPLPAPDKAAVARVRRGTAEWLAIGYPLKGVGDPGYAAVAPLADILTGQPHGRLYRALVLENKTDGVLAQALTLRQGGYFLVAAPLAQGQSMAEARALLVAQLEGLSSQPITPEELQRFQNAWQPLRAQMLANHAQLASLLAEQAALGDWQSFFDQQAKLDELKADEVQRWAQAHFQPQRRTDGELHAADADSLAAAAPPVPVMAAASAVVLDSAAELPAPVDLAAFAEQIRTTEEGIRRGVLDNGLKWALRPLPESVRPVEGILELRFGSETSLAGKRALADLVGTLLIRGSQTRSYQQVVDQVTRLGARLVIQPEGGLLRVRFAVGRDGLVEMLELVADLLRNPAFPDAELQLVKRLQRNAWSTPIGQPAAVAGLQLSRHAAPYPLGDIRRHLEQAEMLAASEPLVRSDLLAFHRDFYGAGLGEFALSGAFDPQQVQAQLQQLLGDWRSRSTPARAPEPYREVAAARLHVRATAPQGGFYLGRLHFDADGESADNPALFVAEHILGRKPLVSRLSRRLREREGLSYDIRTSIRMVKLERNSWVTIQADYPRGQGERLAEVVREEVARLIERGIDAPELERAKRTILHERHLNFAQEANILAQLPRQLHEDFTMHSWIERNQAFAEVTLEQVNAAIRRHFSLEHFVEVLADADGQPWQ